MRRSSFVVLFVFLVVTLLTLTALVHAQYGASLQGTVTDKSGAVVADARVTATNQATGVSRDAVTSGAGFYHIAGLTPGTYKVEVEAPGFKKETTPDVQVGAEATRGLDIALQAGSAQEVVNVTENIETLETENASVTGSISTRQIVDLPAFGRDPYSLVRLAPGIFADASRQGNGNSQAIPQQVGPGGSNSQIFQTENQVQAIADGQRVSANNFMLDGVSVNSLDWGGAAVITPNEESVQEISIASNSYSAQDGRNSGAQIKVISKNGTNVLHGSGLIKFNDKGLNAFNKFVGPNNVTLQQLTCEAGTPSQFTITASHCPSRVDQKYRDFAGSLGGAIIKNKLFFFFSYEGVRLTNTTTARDVKLETPQFEQYVVNTNPGSIAATLFSTPGIAPRISTITSETDCCSLITNPADPNFHALGQWYQPGIGIGQAIGNGPDGTPDWGIFDLVNPNSSSGNQYNGRVDYTQGNNQFFVSTYLVRLNNLTGGNRPLEDLTFQPHNYVGTVGWTRTIGPTMLNEARANFTRWDVDQRQPVGNTNFGIPQIRLFDFDAGGLGDAGRMIGISRAFTTPGALAQNTFGFAETLSWARRQHAWKFGVEIRREQNNNDEPGGQRPDYQFRGLLNLANDACCFFEEVSVDPFGNPLNALRHFRTGDYALFAQDDWKVRPGLTVNLGLRWEYFSPTTETNHLLSNYVAGSQGFVNGSVCGPVAPLTPCHNGDQLYQADRNNFGPRLGFAWNPAKYDNKVVFRGGFGLLFNRYFGTVFDNVRQNTPFFAEVSTCCFFDPGSIVGPPPGSNILYSLGANARANSYPVNPAFSNGVAPDGALCNVAGCATTTPVDLFGALPSAPNPYVYVFSFETQIEPVKNLVATIGYQGSRSRKLVRTIDLNRLIPGDTFDGNKDGVQSASADGVACGASNPACPTPITVGNNRFNRIFMPLPDVNASYDAAIFHLTRRFSHGFQVDSTYTWSHAIDTASFEIGAQQTDPSSALINRGSSDFNITNNFVLDGLWELPLFHGRHDFLGAALGGWTISGIMSKHSGFPFSALIGSCDPNRDRNGDGFCPDLPFQYTGGVISSPSKQQWINGVFPNPAASFPGAATIPPDPSTKGPGCRCRNIFTGPGYTSIDMTLGKDFSLPKVAFLGEGSKLAIRANFFNLFNILNLNPLIPATASTDIVNSGSFGRPSDGLAGRVIEFQARLSF
jgi:carboxypeptidase family protein/TonB-dependent receptor-like protein